MANSSAGAATPSPSTIRKVLVADCAASAGTSLSVSLYMFAMAALTFFCVYLVTETYEDEMAEDVAEEEGAATKG